MTHDGSERLDFQALYSLLIETLTGYVEDFVAQLPAMLAALLIVVLFALLARWIARAASRLVGSLSDSEAVVRLCASLARIATLLGGVFIALNVLQLHNAVMSLLAGAGVVGLALGFAFQDLAANLIAGVYLGFRKPFRISDVVETGEHLGNVRRIDMRNTEIETFAGPVVVLPNRLVFEQALINYTRNSRRRIDIVVGVAYASDLEQVTEVLRSAIEALPFREEGSEVGVWASGFGASSIDFTVLYWIPYQAEPGWFEARHEGVLAIRSALREHGIEIPFPIRTLHAPDAEQLLESALGARSGPSDD